MGAGCTKDWFIFRACARREWHPLGGWSYKLDERLGRGHELEVVTGYEVYTALAQEALT